MRRICPSCVAMAVLALIPAAARAQDPHLAGSFNGYSGASGASPLPMLDDGVGRVLELRETALIRGAAAERTVGTVGLVLVIIRVGLRMVP